MSRLTRPGLAVDVAVPLSVLLLLAAPALFTNKGFVDDWANHLWLAWMQSREIRATGRPTLFLNADPLGVFYPRYLFYGATLYGIGGYLTVLTGNAIIAYVGLLVAALAAAYAGVFWIARQAGLSGFIAHLPAAVLVTSAYYLSLAYGRGSWPELIGTSAIPWMVAAALRILRSGPSPGSVAALGVASVFWSGSHNITLLWGAIFMTLLALALLLALPRPADLKLSQVAIVLVVTGLGVMINGWFLLPDVIYSARIKIAGAESLAFFVGDAFNRPGIVFNPLRVRATDNPYLRSHFTELPVLVMAWLALVLVFWRRRWKGPVRRLLIALGVLIIALGALLLDDSLWPGLPKLLQSIQFTFRLETYIVMTLAGLLVVVLKMDPSQPSQRARDRALSASLTVVVAFGLVLATWQVWNSDAAYSPASRAFLQNRAGILNYPDRTPPSWYSYNFIGSFRDASAGVVATTGAIHLDPKKVKGGKTSQVVKIPTGTGPAASNIAAGPYLVQVRGLEVVGRTEDGYLALDRPVDGSDHVRITVTSNTRVIRTGQWLTIAGLVGLALAIVLSVVLARRRRTH